MASRRTSKPAGAPAIDLALLKAIVDGTQSGTLAYITPAQAVTFGALVEQNAAMTNDTGGCATRATAAGVGYLTTNTPAAGLPAPAASTLVPGVTVAAMASTSPVTFKSGVGGRTPPPRKSTGRGRSEHYPFSTMEINGWVHIPNSAEMPDPAKTLQSTVSSANTRFAVEKKDANGAVIMEDKTVSIAQRDPAGNVMKGADGKLVRHSVTESRPALQYTKRFVIYAVDASDALGAGAVILRTA